MIEVDDTKSDAGERAPDARRGDVDAARDQATGATSLEAQAAAVHFEPLVLQTEFEPGDRTQFHVAELVGYHDRHFVVCVYRAILRRAPSALEQASELDELRSGRASKVEIIERLLSSREARASGRGVRVEGLPSALMRRLARVPVLGYALRLARALVRLPVLMQHQRQFEIYALAQQQLIADYVNEKLAHVVAATTAVNVAAPPQMSKMPPPGAPSQYEEVVEAVEMFSDALLELSNSHADLQSQTQALQQQTQTQVEQAQAALAELTAAITAQQQLAETLRREQQLAADAQQEFLIQEQRVIVETQKVLLEELREELRALSERQQHAREQFTAELQRLRALREEAATAPEENAQGENSQQENAQGENADAAREETTALREETAAAPRENVSNQA